MIKNLHETSKDLLNITLFLSGMFMVLGFCIIDESKSYATNPDFVTLVGGKTAHIVGSIIGEIFSIIKIISIDKSCYKTLDMDAAMGKLYGTGQYFFRFMLTAGVLVAAILMKEIGFLGTTLSILSLQFAGHLLPFYKNLMAKRQSVSQ